MKGSALREIMNDTEGAASSLMVSSKAAARPSSQCRRRVIKSGASYPVPCWSSNRSLWMERRVLAVCAHVGG